MGTRSNVRIEPMNVTWGEDAYLVQTIVCLGDTADSLDGKYFFITNGSGTRFHVWYNTSGGGAADPNPGGSTAAVVAITTGDTAAAVATATEAVIEALTGFTSTVSSATITVTNDVVGYVPGASDGGAPTGFTFAVTTEGESATDLGLVEGNIEVEKEVVKSEIKAQQHGANVLGHIITGKTISVTINLKETSLAQMKRYLRQAGGTFTPAGAGATEVAGWGQYKDFEQTYTYAKKLYLHPTALPASDKTRDLTYWKAYLDLSSLAYSGEDQFTVPATFMIYPDTTKNTKVQYFCYGDASQTMT